MERHGKVQDGTERHEKARGHGARRQGMFPTRKEAPTIRKKCKLVRPRELALLSLVYFVIFLLSSVN